MLVSRGQTLFRTKGKGLGHGHRTVCCPAPWSAYQSQHSIQSHDTWSVWLTGKFKVSVWVESQLEAWEVRWARSVLSHELEHIINWNCECRKVTSYFCNYHRWRHDWIYTTNSVMSSPSPTNGPRTCMKTSYVLEMQHFLGYQIKMNWTELNSWAVAMSQTLSLHAE